jgi:hypothetical protein
MDHPGRQLARLVEVMFLRPGVAEAPVQVSALGLRPERHLYSSSGIQGGLPVEVALSWTKTSPSMER